MTTTSTNPVPSGRLPGDVTPTEQTPNPEGAHEGRRSEAGGTYGDYNGGVTAHNSGIHPSEQASREISTTHPSSGEEALDATTASSAQQTPTVVDVDDAFGPAARLRPII